MEDKPTEEILKELLKNPQERHDGYVREWLKNKEFRDYLHRGFRKDKDGQVCKHK